MSRTEWKIIQRIGFGFLIKRNCSQALLSEGTVRNYLSGILAKLNLRDEPSWLSGPVQTRSQRDFYWESDKWVRLVMCICWFVTVCIYYFFVCLELKLRKSVKRQSVLWNPTFRCTSVIYNRSGWLHSKDLERSILMSRLSTAVAGMITLTGWLSKSLERRSSPDLFYGTRKRLYVGFDWRLNPWMPSNGWWTDSLCSVGLWSWAISESALPVESNPIMMCANKDLLEKEGISVLSRVGPWRISMRFAESNSFNGRQLCWSHIALRITLGSRLW